MNERETLVGIATGTPDGGVAVVRLSGPRAVAIAEGLAGSVGEARRLVRRRLRVEDRDGVDAFDPSRPGVADEVREASAYEDALVAFMPGPNSFTGEDVVELHVHGGETNVRQIVEALLDAGAVAAGRGEFTRRAFENGRLSLDQAEGIAAVIGAQTRAALGQARRLVAGELGREVRALADRLHRLHVEIEANLDFPDDVDDDANERWADESQAVRGELERWLGRFEAGRRAREIPRVVLGGSPNAGKSSLFNALLGRERALVADRPGTTRDFVEARLDLGRHAVELVDTAGVREVTPDAIEAAGIALSRTQLEGADLVVWLVGPEELEARVELPEWLREGELPGTTGCELWVVASQRDRGASGGDPVGRGDARLAVSVRETESVERLRDALHDWARGGDRAPWIGLARHRDCARASTEALMEAEGLLRRDGALELVAFSMMTAVARLREIDGGHQLGPVGDEVLDSIFSSFCIGK